ncbi:hypothetical protein [Pollutimonas sp. M17]|uniref:hypothetical protein n=1 Tax=Pollutimonas sp. M17 TaxID=2962065 RepID=UPI0021F4B1E7|nr:hypothetical protein [Pollutimonas sp. M17]UYO92164.1 hypothetical protein OEG81_09480 [Pollutimonas sp. M17]
MLQFSSFFSAPWRRAATAAGLCLLASTAWAHNPVAECKATDDTTVQCKGGFSDGSDAPGVTLDVISYDEKILVPGKLGEDSTLTFKKPQGEFYILFDAGPGHVVEIDYTEIES